MANILELKSIAAKGGGIILDISKSNLTVLDLKGLASATASGGGTLTLRGADKTSFSNLDLSSIASMGEGHVVFDYAS